MKAQKVRDIESFIKELRIALVKEWAEEQNLDVSTIDRDDLLSMYALMTIKANKREEI